MYTHTLAHPWSPIHVYNCAHRCSCFADTHDAHGAGAHGWSDLAVRARATSVVSTAVDEDKSTRVLREKETVSWAPSSPSRPSLVLGASVERCAPHLGMHAVIRPGSRGSLARTDSSLLVHSSGCEPHLARRPSTSEPPTLRGNPTLRGSSIGRFDGAGFVTPTVAFRGSSAARSTGGLGAAQFL